MGKAIEGALTIRGDIEGRKFSLAWVRVNPKRDHLPVDWAMNTPPSNEVPVLPDLWNLMSFRRAFSALLLCSILGLRAECQVAPSLPKGWQVAAYPASWDLRHSKHYKEDPTKVWKVSLVEGVLKVNDWSYHSRNSTEHSLDNPALSARVRMTARKFHTFLVEQSVDFAINRVVQVRDGWLIGSNCGEWGGGLCWVSLDGSTGRFLITNPHFGAPPPPPPPGVDARKWNREIRANPRFKEPKLPGWIPRMQFNRDTYCSENVHEIIAHRDAYLVFEGLAHMGSNGKVLKVTQDETGTWKATNLMRLDGAPVIVRSDGEGCWIVLTTESLLRMDATGKVSVRVPLPEALSNGPITDVLHEGEGRWLVLTESNLYRIASDGRSKLLLSGAFIDKPEMNSMIRMSDGTVFIGMHHYLLRLTPQGDYYHTERLEPVCEK